MATETIIFQGEDGTIDVTLGLHEWERSGMIQSMLQFYASSEGAHRPIFEFVPFTVADLSLLTTYLQTPTLPVYMNLSESIIEYFMLTVPDRHQILKGQFAYARKVARRRGILMVTDLTPDRQAQVDNLEDFIRVFQIHSVYVHELPLLGLQLMHRLQDAGISLVDTPAEDALYVVHHIGLKPDDDPHIIHMGLPFPVMAERYALYGLSTTIPVISYPVHTFQASKPKGPFVSFGGDYNAFRFVLTPYIRQSMLIQQTHWAVQSVVNLMPIINSETIDPVIHLKTPVFRLVPRIRRLTFGIYTEYDWVLEDIDTLINPILEQGGLVLDPRGMIRTVPEVEYLAANWETLMVILAGVPFKRFSWSMTIQGHTSTILRATKTHSIAKDAPVMILDAMIIRQELPYYQHTNPLILVKDTSWHIDWKERGITRLVLD